MALNAQASFNAAIREFTRTCRCCREDFLLPTPNGRKGRPPAYCYRCRILCRNTRSGAWRKFSEHPHPA